MAVFAKMLRMWGRSVQRHLAVAAAVAALGRVRYRLEARVHTFPIAADTTPVSDGHVDHGHGLSDRAR